MISINLTIFNKAKILERVLDGIFKNTITDFELVAVLDSCTDDSRKILEDYVAYSDNIPKHCKQSLIHIHTITGAALFEVKANNIAAKNSAGSHICIVQDDQIITEHGWDVRLLTPFQRFNDVFAVTARCAHNWEINPYSQDLYKTETDLNKWSDVLAHTDHADKNTVPRDIFAVRSSCNRGPLMINREDLHRLNYFNEAFFPLDMDEHDLMFRARKELGKVCGFFEAGWESEPSFGGTRDEEGNTKRWVLEANQKNTKLFYNLHKDELNNGVFENRNIF